MKEFRNNISKSFKYFKGHIFGVFLMALLLGLIFVFNVIIPVVSAKMIVNLTNGMLIQVVILGIVLFGINQVGNLFWYLQTRISFKIYRDVVSKMQNELGAAILALKNVTLDKNSTGTFIERLNGDTDYIASSVDMFLNQITDILISVGTLFAVYVVNWKAGLFVTLSAIIHIVITYIRVKIYNEKDKVFRKVKEKTVGFIGELVRGTRDIKMLNSEHSFLSSLKTKVDYANDERFKLKDFNRRMRTFAWFVRDLLETGLIVFIIWLITKDELTITSALIIYNYQSRATGFSDAIGYLLDTYKSFNLSCNRIFDIMGSKEFEKEEFGNKHLDNVEGNFEFKHVTFGYNKNQNVLNDLSFKVDANTTVGFVGKSGEGKSTIFSLLCKMYDVNKGEILIDGVNINELDKDSIRGNITIISQDPYIFNLSIKDNLKLVKENLTNKEMREACKMACLDDFIESLPDKYNTIIGEGGVNLSGGQRQRLAIARAFVQKTEIILFDEATSALDNETQKGIQQAIRNLKKDYTILIIAHRLSTIKDCDKIFFISDGKVKSSGTHEELLKKSKDYRELYESEIEK